MAGKVQSKPAGYPSLTPYLIVRGAARAIDFYQKVFGDAADATAGTGWEHGAVAPQPNQTGPISLHLDVDKADAVVRAAEAAGAKLVQPIETKFYDHRSVRSRLACLHSCRGCSARRDRTPRRCLEQINHHRGGLRLPQSGGDIRPGTQKGAAINIGDAAASDQASPAAIK